MRVFFVSHVSEKYGGGRSLLDLIDGLLRRGIECYVVMPRQGPLMKEFKDRHIECGILPIKSWAFSGKMSLKHILCGGLNIFSSLIVAIKAYFWKADIIYSNSSIIPVGALAAFFGRKPHIWHIREFGEEDYGLSFDLGERLSRRLMGWLSFRVIVISDALRQKYSLYISNKKLIMIYDAVSAPGQSCVSVDSKIPILAIIGLIHPAKGQMEAVLAIADLVGRGILVKLKILGGEGNSEYFRQLKYVIIQNKIADYVEFAGYVDDTAPFYSSADIILVCSRHEAFGRVAVEGMLFEKPIIGVRSGATPELIREGFNGLLYEPGNYRELAEKIMYLVERPEEAKRMGENGFREASEKYTIEKCANEVYKILQEVVKSKNK